MNEAVTPNDLIVVFYRQTLNAITQRIESAQRKAIWAVDAKGGASVC